LFLHNDFKAGDFPEVGGCGFCGRPCSKTEYSVDCKHEEYAALVAGLTKGLFVNVFDVVSVFVYKYITMTT
jgi:hypothetical protein